MRFVKYNIIFLIFISNVSCITGQSPDNQIYYKSDNPSMNSAQSKPNKWQEFKANVKKLNPLEIIKNKAEKEAKDVETNIYKRKKSFNNLDLPFATPSKTEAYNPNLIESPSPPANNNAYNPNQPTSYNQNNNYINNQNNKMAPSPYYNPYSNDNSNNNAKNPSYDNYDNQNQLNNSQAKDYHLQYQNNPPPPTYADQNNNYINNKYTQSEAMQSDNNYYYAPNDHNINSNMNNLTNYPQNAYDNQEQFYNRTNNIDVRNTQNQERVKIDDLCNKNCNDSLSQYNNAEMKYLYRKQNNQINNKYQPKVKTRFNQKYLSQTQKKYNYNLPKRSLYVVDSAGNVQGYIVKNKMKKINVKDKNSAHNQKIKRNFLHNHIIRKPTAPNENYIYKNALDPQHRVYEQKTNNIPNYIPNPNYAPIQMEEMQNNHIFINKNNK